MTPSLARWISILAHPFVTASLMALGAGVRSALLVAAFATVPLAVLMAMQVRSGRWDNVDASRPEERPALFAVGGIGLLALAVYLAVTQPVSPLLRGLLAPVGLLAGAALVNRWVKVSLHVGFAVLAAATLIQLGSAVGWVLVPVVPILGWSRLVLNRHQPAELVAGGILGLAASLLTGI
jgi:membrane-associated phospholipid phosphatase